MTCKYNNRRGFTLIEILISLAISSFVLMAALSVYNSSELSYNIQEDIAAMQQDIRVARSFIERDGRMAGAQLNDLAAEPAGQKPFAIENNQGENGSDILTVRYVIPLAGSCGDDPDPTDSIESCSNLPYATLAGDMPVTASVGYISQDLTAAPFDKWYSECYCGDEVHNNTNSSAGSAMKVLIIDKDTGKRFKIELTSVLANSGKFQNRPYDGADTSINKFSAGSTILFMSTKPVDAYKYYLRNNVLMREDMVNDPGNPQPIAEHIEDLQFAFGMDLDGTDEDGDGDNDGDGEFTPGVGNDKWVDCSVSADMNGTDLLESLKNNVRALRINVLGRTAKAREEIQAEKRPALEDHAEASTADHFRRRLSRVVVELRNLDL